MAPVVQICTGGEESTREMKKNRNVLTTFVTRCVVILAAELTEEHHQNSWRHGRRDRGVGD